jgi:hypothetical protein
MYGSSYMFRHYIAIFKKRSYCLLRDAQLRSSRPRTTFVHSSHSSGRYTFSLSVPYLNLQTTELNPISHLLALLGARPKVHISRIKVNLLSSFSPLKQWVKLCTTALFQRRFTPFCFNTPYRFPPLLYLRSVIFSLTPCNSFSFIYLSPFNLLAPEFGI